MRNFIEFVLGVWLETQWARCCEWQYLLVTDLSPTHPSKLFSKPNHLVTLTHSPTHPLPHSLTLTHSPTNSLMDSRREKKSDLPAFKRPKRRPNTLFEAEVTRASVSTVQHCFWQIVHSCLFMYHTANASFRGDLSRIANHQSKLFLKHLLRAVSHLHSLHVRAAAPYPHACVDIHIRNVTNECTHTNML